MLKVAPLIPPLLDPGFVPAVLWNRSYRAITAADSGSRTLIIVLERSDGGVSRFEARVLAADHPAAALSFRYAERLLKFLLWQKGGYRVRVAGAPEIAAYLAVVYSPTGARAFDHAFMGGKVYGRPFSVQSSSAQELPKENDIGLPLGRHLEGCRIGFDLGGSDRKAAAVIDGKVVFSEETPEELTTPPAEGIFVVPVLTGTCVPTLILAGMLSVAIRLGSERSFEYWRFSFAERVSSNCLL